MSCNWPRVQISEVCELIVDCVNKTAPRVDYETPFKMIRTPNVRGGKISLNDCRFVKEDTYEKWTRRAKVLRDDVLLTREAPMGEVGIVDFDETVFLGQRIIQYRVDRSKLDPHFLLYSFLSSELQHQFNMHEGSGSVVSHIRVPDCSKFELNLPPLDVQKDIAGVLKKLDRKISVNQQTNQTLEQMAQAIFKSWFVDFDPVKAKMNGEQPEGMDAATAALFPNKLVESELGLIPEGWEAGDLSDLMDFNPKRTLKKGTIAPYLDMKNMPTSGHLALDIYDREMGSGTKFKNGDSLLARITPCIENGKTAYVDFLENEQVGWGSTEYIVMRSKSDSYKYFSYYMARFEPFRKFAIQSMTGTSGRQRAQAQTVQTMPFAIPPISILEKFDEFVAPNMQMIKSHGSENRTLAALLDTLLPKLLSGEIELTSIENAGASREKMETA